MNVLHIILSGSGLFFLMIGIIENISYRYRDYSKVKNKVKDVTGILIAWIGGYMWAAYVIDFFTNPKDTVIIVTMVAVTLIIIVFIIAELIYARHRWKTFENRD